MNRLVNDLLDTTNIELGHLSIELADCQVETIVEDAVQLVKPLAQQKALNLVYAVGSNVPPLNADSQRLIQILSNLLGNAIKFTPEQGTVTLRTKTSERHVEFIVCDTGPGIPNEQLPHIFEQYWQGNKRKGGAGLGLFIVKGLVEAHNGRIWIQTTLGKGTEMHFTIPVSARSEPRQLTRSQSA
jgi:signal transduction histidine kinase